MEPCVLSFCLHFEVSALSQLWTCCAAGPRHYLAYQALCALLSDAVRKLEAAEGPLMPPEMRAKLVALRRCSPDAVSFVVRQPEHCVVALL